jgi:hypothetical protein
LGIRLVKRSPLTQSQKATIIPYSVQKEENPIPQKQCTDEPFDHKPAKGSFEDRYGVII